MLIHYALQRTSGLAEDSSKKQETQGEFSNLFKVCPIGEHKDFVQKATECSYPGAQEVLEVPSLR